MNRPTLPLVFLCLGLLLLEAPALANPEAEKFIRDRHAELMSLIRQNAHSKIEKTFDEMLDYSFLCRESLRDFWQDLSPKEREQFQCLLRQLVSDAHRKNLSKTLGYEVSFKGTTKTADAFLVTTLAHNKHNPREEPVTIAYLVQKAEGKWRVRDILTEGSSLVENYRNQFRRIVKKNGFSELMRRMRNKLGKAAERC